MAAICTNEGPDLSERGMREYKSIISDSNQRSIWFGGEDLRLRRT